MPKAVICVANTGALAETIVRRLKEAGIASNAVPILFRDKTGGLGFGPEHILEAPQSIPISGIQDALIGMGLTALRAQQYEARITEGSILISVYAAAGGIAHRAEDCMKQSGAEDISTTGEVCLCDDGRMRGVGRQSGAAGAGTIDPTPEARNWRDNFRGWAIPPNPSFRGNGFNKLPGFQRSPPGLERQVLRLLPKLLLLGTLFLGFPSLLARLYSWDGSETIVAMRIRSIDIYMVSAILLHWRIVFTVAIAAFIVLLTKGPAYVADAYPLEDSETPDAAKSKDSAQGRS